MVLLDIVYHVERWDDAKSCQNQVSLIFILSSLVVSYNCVKLITEEWVLGLVEARCKIAKKNKFYPFIEDNHQGR